MDLIERFLNYVSFDTQSSETGTTTPSTQKQLVFAEYLKKELNSLDFDDVYLDNNGYLYATLPANTDKKTPTVGFISHYDTSPDCSGANIKPRIVKNYDGKDITLCEQDGIKLSPAVFPELLAHKGEDLIVTDGHTLLSADDKAGIAEIVQAMIYLKEHPEIKASASQIPWDTDDGYREMLPVMQSDIMLKQGDKTLVIDAKYYSHTTQKQYDVNTLHSGNLYQIFTYVKNLDTDNTGNVSGMLLYAKTDELVLPNNNYKMGGNAISVKTLDLDCDFSEIRRQLDEIVHSCFDSE